MIKGMTSRVERFNQDTAVEYWNRIGSIARAFEDLRKDYDKLLYGDIPEDDARRYKVNSYLPNVILDLVDYFEYLYGETKSVMKIVDKEWLNEAGRYKKLYREAINVRHI